MKILLIILAAAVSASSIWGYSAWESHRAAAEAAQDRLGDQTAKNALTPWKNPGTTMNNPFGIVKQ